jgi:hypothetical protein
MVNRERWTSLAAEYENVRGLQLRVDSLTWTQSCARLTLIKPEIKPVFCHTLKKPIIKSKMELRHEEYRRRTDVSAPS